MPQDNFPRIHIDTTKTESNQFADEIIFYQDHEKLTNDELANLFILGSIVHESMANYTESFPFTASGVIDLFIQTSVSISGACSLYIAGPSGVIFNNSQNLALPNTRALIENDINLVTIYPSLSQNNLDLHIFGPIQISNNIDLSTSGVDDRPQKVFWNDSSTNTTYRSNLDGTNITAISSGLDDIKDVTANPHTNKIMISTTHPTNKIIEMDFDGQNVSTLITGIDAQLPYGVTYDLVNEKMYWADLTNKTIKRANLDGSSKETVHTFAGSFNPFAIIIDTKHSKIYWSDILDGKIRRSNFDSTDIEDFVDTGVGVRDIDLDVAALKLYWSNRTLHTINRINLNGSDQEVVLDETDGLQAPYGIAVDPYRSKVYWTDQGDGTINSADYDGTNIDQIQTGLGFPEGIAVDRLQVSPSSLITITNDISLSISGVTSIEKLFWVDVFNNVIYKSTYNGSDLQVIQSGIGDPVAVFANPEDELLYFTDTTAFNKIRRMDFNGSGLTTLVSGVAATPYDIQIDLNKNKIYWADLAALSIFRSNINGSNIETIISGLSAPRGIALNIRDGLMYYSDTGQGSIFRSTLNGQNTQTIVSGLTNVRHIDIDINEERLFWADRDTSKVSSSDLDGSNIVDIVTSGDGVSQPEGVVVDPSGQFVFWTDQGTHSVHRAKYDGSNIQTIAINVPTPNGISLVRSQELPSSTNSFHLFMSGSIAISSGVFSWSMDNLLKTGGHNPQLIGNLNYIGSSGDVYIQVWELRSGVPDELVLQNSGCYPIGNTGRWGWSTSDLPISNYGRPQYHYLMSAPNTNTFEGHFFMDSRPRSSNPESAVLQPAMLEAAVLFDHYVWFTDIVNGSVQRVSWVGGTREFFLTGQSSAKGIDTDRDSNLIFFVQNDNIIRANSNTGAMSIVASGQTGAKYLSVNPIKLHIYFSIDDKIKRCDYSGSGMITVLDLSSEGSRSIDHLVIDNDNERIYFTEVNQTKIRRCNFLGGDLQDVVTSPSPSTSSFGGISLSNDIKDLYFAHYDTNSLTNTGLYVSLGAEATHTLAQCTKLLTDNASFVDLFVDTNKERIYVIRLTLPSSYVIRYYNLDGELLGDLVTTFLSLPYAMSQGKLNNVSIL